MTREEVEARILEMGEKLEKERQLIEAVHSYFNGHATVIPATSDEKMRGVGELFGDVLKITLLGVTFFFGWYSKKQEFLLFSRRVSPIEPEPTHFLVKTHNDPEEVLKVILEVLKTYFQDRSREHKYFEKMRGTTVHRWKIYAPRPLSSDQVLYVSARFPAFEVEVKSSSEGMVCQLWREIDLLYTETVREDRGVLVFSESFSERHEVEVIRVTPKVVQPALPANHPFWGWGSSNDRVVRPMEAIPLPCGPHHMLRISPQVQMGARHCEMSYKVELHRQTEGVDVLNSLSLAKGRQSYTRCFRQAQLYDGSLLLFDDDQAFLVMLCKH